VVAVFKDRSPVAVVWLLLLSIIVHSHFFIQPPIVMAAEEDGLISFFLNRWLNNLPAPVNILLYHTLVIVQALRLNYLFNDQRMFTRSNFLTAMVYIILTGMFNEWGNITPALVANIMVIWLFAKTSRMYNTPNPKTLLFNIGLIIGVSVLLYHPSTLLVLVAVFALLVVRPFRITEWLVMLMGILCPYYFLFSFLFLTDKMQRLDRYVPDWQLNLPNVQSPILFFTTIGIIIIAMLIGIFYWQSQSRRMLIQVRKNWAALIVMLLVMIPLPFISKNATLDSLFLWIVPVSPFIAKGFIGPKRPALPNIMFWTLIVLSLLNTWYIIKN
jgi:hypothetical protein